MSDPNAKPARLRLLGTTVVIPFSVKPMNGWPGITGTVRPATTAETRAYFEEQAGAKTAAEKVRATSRFVADKLKSWDVVGEGDQPAPITPEAVASLPDGHWVALETIATGYDGGQALGNSGSPSGS